MTTTTATCLAKHDDGDEMPYICTRERGHDGAHVADDGAGGVEWPAGAVESPASSRMSIRIHASGKIERPLWWPRSRLLMVPAGLDLPSIFKVCEELERRSGEPLFAGTTNA